MTATEAVLNWWPSPGYSCHSTGRPALSSASRDATANANGTMSSRVPWWKITPASPGSTNAGLIAPAIDTAPHTAEENSGFDAVDSGSVERIAAPADMIAPAEYPPTPIRAGSIPSTVALALNH